MSIGSIEAAGNSVLKSRDLEIPSTAGAMLANRQGPFPAVTRPTLFPTANRNNTYL
jgi:hypothetical protein